MATLALAGLLGAGAPAESGKAQVGTMPPGAGGWSQSDVPAGRGMGGIPQAPAEPGLDPAGSLQERALTAMEMLREEIVTLTALRDAQTALLAWNGDSAKTGEAPASLPAALCDEPALAGWCALLPATFGGVPREDGHGRD